MDLKNVGFMKIFGLSSKSTPKSSKKEAEETPNGLNSLCAKFQLDLPQERNAQFHILMSFFFVNVTASEFGHFIFYVLFIYWIHFAGKSFHVATDI